jgi:hypothetical protein
LARARRRPKRSGSVVEKLQGTKQRQSKLQVPRHHVEEVRQTVFLSGLDARSPFATFCVDFFLEQDCMERRRHLLRPSLPRARRTHCAHLRRSIERTLHRSLGIHDRRASSSSDLARPPHRQLVCSCARQEEEESERRGHRGGGSGDVDHRTANRSRPRSRRWRRPPRPSDHLGHHRSTRRSLGRLFARLFPVLPLSTRERRTAPAMGSRRCGRRPRLCPRRILGSPLWSRKGRRRRLRRRPRRLLPLRDDGPPSRRPL